MICTCNQKFHQNANSSYKLNGLIGHTGYDASCGFGSPIHSLYSGVVYKVLTKNTPANDGSGFTGVFMIVDDGIECFEWLVGHCNPSVSEGQYINKGDIIGTEANHGTVYSDGKLITLAMQAAGDTRGSHRHYQKRPVVKVARTSPAYMYLSRYSDRPAGTIYYNDGGYFQIWNYDNGFNGCVNPQTPVFNRALAPGMSGYDVFVLQRILNRSGALLVSPTGFYGALTIAAVTKFQKTAGLTPVGVVGPKTTLALNAYLTPPPSLLSE